MKRIFVFAVLAGAFAVPVSMAQAQMGDAAAPQQTAPVNPAPSDAEGVQPAQRGALGGLASGAPSVGQTVPSGTGAAPQGGVAQAPAGQAPVAGAPAAGAPAAGAPAAGGVAGQGVVAQQGVAGQAVGGQAVAGQAVGGTAAVAQTGVAATGTAVVGVQQSLMSRMQQHFLVQQAFHHCMFFSEFQPHVIKPEAFGPIGFGPGPFFGPVAVDLELISVGMVADGIADKGPMYRVTFKNHSAIAVHH